MVISNFIYFILFYFILFYFISTYFNLFQLIYYFTCFPRNLWLVLERVSCAGLGCSYRDKDHFWQWRCQTSSLCFSSQWSSPKKSPWMNSNRRMIHKTEMQQNSAFETRKYIYYVLCGIFSLNYVMQVLQLAARGVKPWRKLWRRC